MYTKIRVSLKYITILTPNPIITFNILKRRRKIFCKNLLFFFLILEFLQNNKIKNNKKINFNLFCKPTLKRRATYLRTPNRSKSSQVILSTSRYNILLTITFTIFNLLNGGIQIHNTLKIVGLLKIYYINFNFFESNILILNSLSITINYIYLYKIK